MTRTSSTSALIISLALLGITVLNIGLQPSRHAMRVAIERVELKPIELVVRAPGTIEAKDSSTVRAQFDATILQKLFREGQTVTAGQKLLVLDREKIRIEHQSRADTLANAQADLSKAHKEVRLQKALYAKQAVAYSAVEDASRAVIKAEQNLRSAKESFRQAQLQWNSAVVVAPIDGTVVKDWIGEEKQIGNAKEIVTVADVSEYSARVQIDEIDIKRVKEGQLVDVRIQSLPLALLQGKVMQIGAATESPGSLPQVPLVIRLVKTGGTDLRPKLTAEARILTGVTEPVFSVPLEALVNSDGETRLWVVDGIGRLRARKIELGRTTISRVEVLKGVSVGDRVVIVAEPDFAEGMRVMVGASPKGTSRTRALMGKLKEGEIDSRPRARKVPRRTVP